MRDPSPTESPAPTAPRLVPVRRPDDVLAAYRDTPIGHLLLAQNLERPFPDVREPVLLVATCIDPRVRLRLPRGAAFEMRSAGVNLEGGAAFQIDFVLSVVRVGHVALISHDDCAMTRLASQREAFVEGMAARSDQGESDAAALFDEHVRTWHREDAIGAVVEHARALRRRFPGATIAPLHCTVGDGRLHQVVDPKS